MWNVIIGFYHVPPLPKLHLRGTCLREVKVPKGVTFEFVKRVELVNHVWFRLLYGLCSAESQWWGVLKPFLSYCSRRSEVGWPLNLLGASDCWLILNLFIKNTHNIYKYLQSHALVISLVYMATAFCSEILIIIRPWQELEKYIDPKRHVLENSRFT